MDKILRTWVFSQEQTNSWCIWDLGDEMWELKNEILRHFRVVSRTLLSPQTLEETVEILCDCPIPLEAIERRSAGVGWIVSEEVITLALGTSQKEKQMQEEVQQTVAGGKIQQPVRHHQQPQAPSEESSGLALPLPLQKQMQKQMQKQKHEQKHEQKTKVMSASSPSLSPVSSQPADEKRKSQKEKQVQKPKALLAVSSKEDNKIEQESQSSYSSHGSPASANSKQLWSSLSEWIPSSALYQPSLHSQAFLEISEKPIHIFVSPTGVTSSGSIHRRRRPKQLPLLIV